MSGSTVVIVESPAKAKTINKYLGSGYTVLASYGHIRDLPAKDGSVRPDDDFSMVWELGERSRRHVDEIAAAVRRADHVVLATDPDREGEAIAWHVAQVLDDRKLTGTKDVKRVTFNEITKSAVTEAMARPRDVDRHLVDAYMARRALDYLVGFTLSPVLWRKLPGSRSAGRVQSVALRLICEREAEIEAFRPREYWSIEAMLTAPDGSRFPARLHQLDGKTLDKFALPDQPAAEAAAARVRAQALKVASVERRQVRRNPFPPFTTSTLQQEASRKLGLGATRTMRIAQKLYEGVDIGGETVGLITYMRTDGVQLSQEAINAARALIGAEYGAAYLPSSPRVYKSTAKNAQEAHEAIRPTDLGRRPAAIARHLEKDELALYALIWQRTVASQMESAVLDQVTVDMTGPGGDVGLRSTGSILKFDGFQRVYRESRDEPADDNDEDRRLPALETGNPVGQHEIRPEQHFTQPPPRYTEAGLVKRLEELGIGRPSTYASILQVLQDRNYVRLDRRRFVPEDRGRLVTSFLTSFFERYVEYGFTADLENQLDAISAGEIDWKALLRDFWSQFSGAVEGTRDLTISQVLEALDAQLGQHFFRPDGSGADPRGCPRCADGRLGLKLGKFGAFIGCSNYPTCPYTRPLAMPGQEGEEDADTGPRLLGQDPETTLPVTVRRGPYGAYVQLGPPDGEAPAAKADKPKRVSLPKGVSAAEIDLDTALALLALPREVGRHPESGEPILAGIGRFGPYLKHGSVYKSLAGDDDVLTIGLNRAVVLLAAERPGRAAARALGDHPSDGKPVTLNSGRYGPYVKHGRTMASLPKSTSADALTLDEAVALLAAKAAKSGDAPAKGGKARAAKAADDGAAEPARRKAPAKKAAADSKSKAPGSKAKKVSGAASRRSAE